MNLEILINDTNQKNRTNKEKILNLYRTFEQRRGIKYHNWAYEITFGFLVAEYVLKLKDVSVNDNIDKILLLARRLLEVFIISKYVITTNQFPIVLDYCVHDRYKYLEGAKARAIADERLFPELAGVDNFLSEYQEQEDELLEQYGSFGKKMPTMKQMAEKVGYLDEYNYFYKFTSKLLHFCPFTLNGDAGFNKPLDKVIFLCRVAKYLEKIGYELEIISKKIPNFS